MQKYGVIYQIIPALFNSFGLLFMVILANKKKETQYIIARKIVRKRTGNDPAKKFIILCHFAGFQIARLMQGCSRLMQG